MDSTNRFNTIAFDTSAAVIDRLATMQSQAVNFTEFWLKTVSESQKATIDMSKALLKQSFEAQNLWGEFARESAKDLGSPFAAFSAGEAKNGKAAAK